MVTLTTNLANLPALHVSSLSNCLSVDGLWYKLIDDYNTSPFYENLDEVDRIAKKPNPGEHLLRLWGNRGLTVHSLLTHLQVLSQRFGKLMDPPQLILNRKYKPVRFSRPEEVVVSIVNDGTQLRLECKAIGFPYPKIQWLCNDKNIEINNDNKHVLILPRCKCTSEQIYKCNVSNEVSDGYSYSAFYRRPDKEYSSSIVSKDVDLSVFVPEGYRCPNCRPDEEEELHIDQKIRDMVLNAGDEADDARPPVRVELREVENLIATDKVALIISNCIYRYLPELITPHCDAETLAMELQAMDYKTVSLADLTLEEMRYMIKEYRKLLGKGVYAVFYFVGHGFEVNGQCYLLAIDAPVDAHKPQHSLSVDWILATLRDKEPALHLLLLDVCRKFIPFDCVPAFVEYAEQFKAKHRAKRNTIYGYSTSGGVGAYEVKGEVNGVFMKYLKNHVCRQCSVMDMLHGVLRDIEEDKKVCNLQIPELRSTLTRPRALHDPLIVAGHTCSFEQHNIHWRLMHELPTPVHIKVPALKLEVTIWFSYCGHFTNKVYVFSSVQDLSDINQDYSIAAPGISQYALQHLAVLRFPEELRTSNERICADEEEGVSLCVLLSNLQRTKEELKCLVELKHKDRMDEVVTSIPAVLGHVLITQLEMLKNNKVV